MGQSSKKENHDGSLPIPPRPIGGHCGEANFYRQIFTLPHSRDGRATFLSSPPCLCASVVPFGQYSEVRIPPTHSPVRSCLAIPCHLSLTPFSSPHFFLFQFPFFTSLPLCVSLRSFATNFSSYSANDRAQPRRPCHIPFLRSDGQEARPPFSPFSFQVSAFILPPTFSFLLFPFYFPPLCASVVPFGQYSG